MCLASIYALLPGLAAPRRIHLVVNPFGGGGAGLAARDAVLPIFEAAGVEVTELQTKYAGHAGDFARTVPLQDGFVGIGGDGTAHEIANGMLRRPEAERVPVGIIPAGSGNTWAFDLGLDDAVSAARIVASGATTDVDVLAISSTGQPEVVEEYAINIAGYGMPAAVLSQANALRWLGSAQYELAGLVLIASGRTSFDAEIEIEGEDGACTKRRLEGFSFVQGQVNQHMGKRVPFAPYARMDDGLLDLVLVTKAGGLDIIYSNALARTGEHTALPFVEVVRCRSFTLRPTGSDREGSFALRPTGSDREDGITSPQSLNLDGELTGVAPFRAACVPGALRVYASRLRTDPNVGDVGDPLYALVKFVLRL